MRSINRTSSRIRKLRRQLETLVRQPFYATVHEKRKRTTRRGLRGRYESLEQRIVLSATDALTVTIDPASISEFGETSTATVSRETAAVNDLVVSLQSSDLSEANVPATVTIHGGSTSATFTIAAVDDAIADGTQSVTVSAAAQDAGGFVGLDASFGDAGLATTVLAMSEQPPHGAMSLQADGKIVSAADGAVANQMTLTRLNPDGTLDTTFGNNGVTLSSFSNGQAVPYKIVVQADGMILVGGRFAGSTAKPFLARYDAKGTLDTSYGAGGVAVLSQSNMDNRWIEDFDIAPDGSVVAALGVNGAGSFLATRVTANGTLDTTFGGFNTGIATYQNSNASRSAVASAIKVLDSGQFLLVGESSGSGIVIRSEANGWIDAGFGVYGERVIDFGTNANFVRFHSIRVDTSDRIVIGSFVSSGADTADFATARLNPDGSFDTTFDDDGMVVTDVTPGRDDLTSSVEVQPNGKVIAIGYSDTTSGNVVSVVRYNEDGSLDTSFDADGIIEFSAGSSVNQRSFETVLQAFDGRLLVLAGWGSDVRIARLEMGGLVGSGVVKVTDNEPVGPFVVDTLADEDDGNYSPGEFSLREAIRLANTQTGDDQIGFSPSLAGGTITLTMGQLVVTDSISIDGNAAANLTVSGGNQSRIFNLDNVPASGSTQLTISNLKIADGHTSGDYEGGGAIRSTGFLTLNNVEIINSHTTGASSEGGAIFQSGRSLQLNDTLVSGNSTAGSNSFGGAISAYRAGVSLNTSVIEGNSTLSDNNLGGGIYANQSTVKSNWSTIANNANEGANAYGGGAFFLGSRLTLNGSTVSGNTTSVDGGGIAFEPGGQSVFASITNATFSGNTATSGYGGGIVNFNGTMTVQHSTITANTAPEGQGSGLANYLYGAAPAMFVTSLRSNIIADNTHSDIDFGGVLTSSPITSLGYNLVGSGNSTNSFSQSTDQVDVSAQLAPLADNGGVTLTHALLPGSLALDAGDPSTTVSVDQRGAGFLRLVGDSVDAGAFELQATNPRVTFSLDQTSVTEASGQATFTAQLSELSGVDVAVYLRFAGTATQGTDYNAPATQIVIPAGQLTGSITVTATPDTVADDGETVVVYVATVTGGFSAGHQAQTLTIDEPLTNGEIHGVKWSDDNGNGVFDLDESVLAGVTIYLDLNDDGVFDAANEPSTVTSANGDYAFTDVVPGSYVIRELVPAGYTQTFPRASSTRLFAIDPNLASPTQIVEIDPNNGATLNRFEAPHSLIAIDAGLAFDGHTLYYVDASTDILYELNPDSGAIVDSMSLSAAGKWDGIAVLNGLVYLSDPSAHSIQTIDPTTNSVVGTLVLPISNHLPAGGLGELPGATGGQLIAPIGSSSSVALLNPTTGLANSSFSHQYVSGGENVGATSIDGLIYLGFSNSLGTVQVYTPSGSFVRSFNTGFDMSGLGASSFADGAHRVELASGETLTDLDFGNQPAGLSLTLAHTAISELGGTTTATVTRQANFDDELTVTLMSDDTSEATVVGTVIIAAGQATSASFSITAVDDLIVDSDQIVTIGALATGFRDAVATLLVQDNDVAALTVTVDRSAISENGGIARGTVTRNTSTDEDLLVALTSSDLSEVTVPTTVTIPAGQAAVSFDISGVDDTIADETQTVNIVASSLGTYPGVYSDDFSGDNLSPAWTAFTNIPYSTVTQFDGQLRIDSSVAPANYVDSGLRNKTKLDNQSFVASVDFRLPQGNAMPWLQIASTPDGESAQVYGLYYYPPGRTYRLWIDDNVTAGNVYGLNGIGDERTAWHQFKIEYDAATHTAYAFVDNVLANTANLDLSEAVVSIYMKDSANLGSTGHSVAEFDNFSFTYRDVFLDGSAAIDVLDDEPIPLTITHNDGFAIYHENGGQINLTVHRAGSTTETLTVDVVVTPDGQLTFPSTLTFAAGSATAVLVGTPINDLVDEPDQAFSVSVGTPGVTTVPVFSGTILDDDVPPAFILEYLDATSALPEGGIGNYRVRRTGALTDAVDVTITNLRPEDAAVFSSDVSNGVISLGPGVASANFRVYITDDSLDEPTEILTVTASANGYTTGVLDRQIIDNDNPTLTLAIDNSVLVENGAAAIGSVTRNTASNQVGFDQPLVVYLSSSDVSEVTVPSSVTIPAGQSTVTFNVTPVDDHYLDGTKQVTILSTSNGFVSSSIEVSVNDDEAPLSVTVSLDNDRIDENGGVATATVTLSALLESPASFTIGLDPTGMSSRLSSDASVVIASGSFSNTFTLTGVDNAILDGNLDGSVVLFDSLSAPVASAPVAVVDDEVFSMSLALSSDTISELDGTAIGTITLDFAQTSDLVISLTSSDTGEAIVDVPSMTIAAGNRTATFVVSAVDDVYADGDQSVTIAAVAEGIAPIDQTISVMDNESALSLTLAPDPILVDENGDAVVTVSLNHPLETAVDYSITMTGTALNGRLSVPANLTVAADSTTATFIVSGIDNVIDEGDASGTLQVGDASAVITVLDDDTAVLALQVSPTAISENGGTAMGTVSLSNPMTTPLTVRLSSSNTSEATVPASVIVPAGELSATFTINAVDDDVLDGTQTVVVSASGAGDATATVWVTDDEVSNSPPQLLSMVAPDLNNLGMFDQAVTVSGAFTDADLADSHTITIDWGDGHSETLSASQLDQQTDTFAATHVYGTGGVFEVTVTVSDGQADDVGTVNSVISGVGVVGQTLYVIGTPAKDDIDLKQVSVRRASERLNVSAKFNQGRDQTTVNEDFDPTSIDRIIVFASDGNDKVTLQKNVQIDAIILGGKGDDDLSGGSGRDLIVGGAGSDSLRGGDDDDLLIGTSWDDESNLTALDAIHREWTSDSDYTTKLDHLTGNASGGKNGSVVLDASTLSNDNDRDMIQGDSGRDLYFANFTGSQKDKIKDRRNDETIVSLF